MFRKMGGTEAMGTSGAWAGPDPNAKPQGSVEASA